MGTVYKISCKCGYNKDLNLGCGLSSCNVKTVRRIFSEEELKEFNDNFNNGNIKEFIIENVAAFCKKCGEIEVAAKLNVEMKNGYKFEILSKCPICGNKVAILNDLDICPICNSHMHIEENGLWD